MLCDDGSSDELGIPKLTAADPDWGPTYGMGRNEFDKTTECMKKYRKLLCEITGGKDCVSIMHVLLLTNIQMVGNIHSTFSISASCIILIKI